MGYCEQEATVEHGSAMLCLLMEIFVGYGGVSVEMEISHTHTYTHTHTLTHPHTLTHTYTHTLIHTYSDVEVFLVGTDNTVSVERSRPSLASSYCVLTEHMLAASTCPRCPSLQALDNGG